MINEYIEENEKALNENQIILSQLESLRDDLNILATYIKQEQTKQDKIIKSLNDDFSSLDEAVAKKVKEIVGSLSSIATTNNNTNSDTTYIKNLLSDDFKEMQTGLINQVKELISNLNGGKKWKK